MSLRTPALLRAVVAGLAAGLLGTGSWTLLVTANIRHGSAVPWATAVMAVVLGRLISLPQQQELDPSKFAFATVFAWVIMGALVAGVVEETALRGYVQGGIERHHGPVLAIFVTGSLFGLAHFSHPEVGIALLPYYIAVSAVYGGLAYATDSTFPGMVLHSGGNLLSAFSLFAQGRSEWQLGNSQPTLVWQSGVDAEFVASVILLLIVSAVACLAYKALISGGRPARLHAG